MVAMETSSRVGSDILHQWLPNNFQKKSLNWLAFALILKKYILTSIVAAGRISPGLNRTKKNKKILILRIKCFSSLLALLELQIRV